MSILVTAFFGLPPVRVTRDLSVSGVFTKTPSRDTAFGSRM
jgi:hypothetical protein